MYTSLAIIALLVAGVDVSPLSPVFDPCQPTPCGPNSACRLINSNAICSCLPNHIGAPPNCKPECVMNRDCAKDKACINLKCQDPCPGACGENATCAVVNYVPVCTCAPDWEGDPYAICVPKPLSTCVKNSDCEPNEGCSREKCQDPCPGVCGENAGCKTVNHLPICTCSPGLTGDPYNICHQIPDRTKCMINRDCAEDRACINLKCQDPCPGVCGENAGCKAVNHIPICTCAPGSTGDPFRICQQIRNRTCVRNSDCEPNKGCIREKCRDPCPGSCGTNAGCKAVNHTPVCTCSPGFTGDPFISCQQMPDRTCVKNSDCEPNEGCIREKCRDPCPGVCGTNAGCKTVNHTPVCTCSPGSTGDPFTICRQMPDLEASPSADPCRPSPCGPDSNCHVINNSPVCSCADNSKGSPPNCRAACVANTDCGKNRACINQKCQDPCPKTCGLKASCEVVNHNPICKCPPGLVGDPFVICKVEASPATDPCRPSPCGPDSNCHVINNSPVCSCADNSKGSPPNCRAACVANTDCGKNRACINQKCQDPCPKTCGLKATCEVINHNPICSCPPGLVGDPFVICKEPSSSLPCEKNGDCDQHKLCINHQCKDPCVGPEGVNLCGCSPGVGGNPAGLCGPEQPKPSSSLPCEKNGDCDQHKLCINHQCKDPCVGPEGVNLCGCSPGVGGNPAGLCGPERPSTVCANDSDCGQDKVCVDKACVDPCSGICGTNARCRLDGRDIICSCPAGYAGNPYILCLPWQDENEGSSFDLCVPSPCGVNGKCHRFNRTASCSCPPGMTGDPYLSCSALDETIVSVIKHCEPSPCGPNGICNVVKGAASCTCPPGMTGDAYIRCTAFSKTTVSVISHCDPSPCGPNGICHIVKEVASCSCPPGMTGDPYIRCGLLDEQLHASYVSNPCTPSPCGPNSQCLMTNGYPECKCQKNFTGSPPNCRPECVVNGDCEKDKACVDQKCTAVCPGECGANECHVFNHIPVCSCPPDEGSDPLTRCRPVLERSAESVINHCNPSPCGPNGICNVVKEVASCSCPPGMTGDPYIRCGLLDESNVPVTNQCAPSPCGPNAMCNIVNGAASCSCPPGMTGDAYIRCSLFAKHAASFPNPCEPSPCGPNSQCLLTNGHPGCKCQANFTGSPPNCRPK